MGLQQVTAATTPLFSPEALRLHCSIEPDNTIYDPLLADYIASATAMVEEFTGRSLGQQEWTLSLPGFNDHMLLPRGPVTAVGAIAYTDVAGADHVLPDTGYDLDLSSDPQLIVRPSEAIWPATKAGPSVVRISFTTGYAVAPPMLAQAIRATVAAWFLTREATALPAGVTKMLEPFVSQWIFA